MRTGSITALGFALLACAAPSAAIAGPWHVGLRAGPSMTNLHGDLADLAEPKYQVGVVAGAFTEFNFSSSTSIALEAAYVSKGAKFEGQSTDPGGNVTGSVDNHLRLTYLETSFLARATLPVPGPARVYVVAGPTAGIALKAKDQIGHGFSDVDFTDDLQSPDLGAIGGLGARFGRGTLEYGVEARYSTGFNDLWDIADNLESINHGFSLTLSVSR